MRRVCLHAQLEEPSRLHVRDDHIVRNILDRIRRLASATATTIAPRRTNTGIICYTSFNRHRSASIVNLRPAVNANLCARPQLVFAVHNSGIQVRSTAVRTFCGWPRGIFLSSFCGDWSGCRGIGDLEDMDGTGSGRLEGEVLRAGKGERMVEETQHGLPHSQCQIH